MHALPRSLDPLVEESLAGYLLRSAHRLDLTPARLMILTGLLQASDAAQASASLLIRLPAAARSSFATATRLTQAEVDSLTLATFADRYPLPKIISNGPGRSRIRSNPRVFAPVTRYCPRCLAGDGSPIQNAHGGPWRKTWYLPTTFACLDHQLFLADHCPVCLQSIHRSQQGNLRKIVPFPQRAVFNPVECRARSGSLQEACGARLDSCESPRICPDETLMGLQYRLLELLYHNGLATVTSCGQPTTPICYFNDLLTLSSLVVSSWPTVRDLASSNAIAAALDRHAEEQHRAIANLSEQSATAQHISRLLDTPPMDAMISAGLLIIADRLLNLTCADDVRDQLQTMLSAPPHRNRRATWGPRFDHMRSGCSTSLQEAYQALSKSLGRAAVRNHSTHYRHTKAVPLTPNWLPAFLPEPWYRRYFGDTKGINPLLLRRVVMIRLVQMASGWPPMAAADFLGINSGIYMPTGRVLSWARSQCDQHWFDRVLIELERDLEADPRKVDYRHRRNALRDWTLNTATWSVISSQLPLTTDHEDLGDLNRQCASIVIWAQITKGEYRYAPRPIENIQTPEVQHAWRCRRRAILKRLQHAKSLHDACLKELLLHHADQLEIHIDSLPNSASPL